MKQLKKIKSRLPPGINVRISSKNVLSFRVCFRKKGFPEEIETFSDEEQAKMWLAKSSKKPLLNKNWHSGLFLFACSKYFIIVWEMRRISASSIHGNYPKMFAI
ncbi:MAG: hypothetical protein H0V82_05585 [Candidatus Protochlamydia sp.]|nr:hypothetical protein [Candidatus Protochlamydia sp.]